MKKLILAALLFTIPVVFAGCVGKKLRIYPAEDCQQTLSGEWVCEE